MVGRCGVMSEGRWWWKEYKLQLAGASEEMSLVESEGRRASSHISRRQKVKRFRLGNKQDAYQCA